MDATLMNIRSFKDDTFLINEFLFLCPIDYKLPRHNENCIELSFKLVHGEKAGKIRGGLRVKNESTEKILSQISRHKILVYLCGGPGDKNPPSRLPELNRYFLERGYWILYPDYRGTGDSSSAEIAWSLDHPDESRALYMIAQLGQRNIVRDLEAVRAVLCRGAKWTICAQSYGGWITYSYLSFCPSGLKRVCLNAGVAPIHYDPVSVHQRLFRNIIKRNEAYYFLYPDDVARVKRIAVWLAGHNGGGGIEVPGWGRITVHQFLCLGRNLGAETKYAQLHRLCEKMADDIAEAEPGSGSLSAATIALYRETDNWRFDQRPLYAVLNESQYLRDGKDAARWVAQGVARSPEFRPFFWWVNSGAAEIGARVREQLQKEHEEQEDMPKLKLYLSGEMVYDFFFDNYAALRPFRRVAMELAADGSGRPTEASYDLAQLKRNRVPVTSVQGSADVIVDPDLAFPTWVKTGNVKACELEGLEHGAIRSDTRIMLNAHTDLMQFE
ncbi:Alpha/Beta hydrolase protein [Biscogniauxia mediterranea]|nr:Alpha/Beta hydrolase protein [Biscogniauxia mediterranea]